MRPTSEIAVYLIRLIDSEGRKSISDPIIDLEKIWTNSLLCQIMKMGPFFHVCHLRGISKKCVQPSIENYTS